MHVKKEAITDPSKGKKPEDRTTEELLNKGILIIDKPPGPTSHQTVDYLKKILGIKKAGHTGTLDPGVTGVLPIALNKATRITHSLLTAGKEYVCLMHLHKDINNEDLNKVLEKFKGEIEQLPPKKSAVKRRLRKRNIYSFEVLERKEKDVLIRVGCEAGTYIRKLVHDIGLQANTGAHMSELRRTKAGPFTEDRALTLHEVSDYYHFYKEGKNDELRKHLIPIEEGVSHLKKIIIHDSAIPSLCQGAYLKVPGILELSQDIKKDDLVAVFSLKNELVLVGIALMNSEELINNEKGIAVKTSQVFMEPGIY